MRYLFGFICVLALGVVPLVGCGETAGTGGSGGDGCTSDGQCDDGDLCTDDFCHWSYDERGGSCYTLPRCEFAEDDNECTSGSVCDPVDGTCDLPLVEDGSACADGLGTCRGGECRMPCTEQALRDAVAVAATGRPGPYTFDCDGPTTLVTEESIKVDSPIILDGEGNLTLDGNYDHRLLYVWRTRGVELMGFTFTRGRVDYDETTGKVGGCIVSTEGGLHLTDVRVLDCEARSGGGISSHFGTTVLSNVEISGNTAGGNGGGIYSLGTLVLENVAVVGNVALGLGISDGNRYGAGIVNIGGLTMHNSTVSGNRGDGIYTLGICTQSGGDDAIITNSTISGNEGDGVRNVDAGGAACPATSPLTLLHVTIANNQEYAVDGPADAVSDTIIEGECERGINSRGDNIESPGDTCGFHQGTDQVNVSAADLNLGPLQDNGGPTMTHALLPGSVAIDVIPAAECLDAEGEALTTDQRGFPRDSMCDVGAFEVQP